MCPLTTQSPNPSPFFGPISPSDTPLAYLGYVSCRPTSNLASTPKMKSIVKWNSNFSRFL